MVDEMCLAVVSSVDADCSTTRLLRVEGYRLFYRCW